MASEQPISLRLSAEIIQKIDRLAESEVRNRSNMITALLRRATDTTKAIDIFQSLIARASDARTENELARANEQIYLAQHLIRSTMGDAVYEQVVEALKSDGYTMPSKPWL